MRNSFAQAIVLIVLAAFILNSCAPPPPPGTALTPEDRSKAQKMCIAKYTGLGALGGALVGALIGGKESRGKGALIGAAAGGALAFAIAWGKCMAYYSDLNSYPVANAQETAQKIGYNPSQGNVTKIETFSLNPEGISPGGQVQINGSYYIMAPEGTTEVKVTEKRIVDYFDSSKNEWVELGSVDNEVTSALGTRKAEGHFDLPADIPEGRYRMTLKIIAQGKEDQVSQELKVQKGLAMGPSNYQQQSQPIKTASVGASQAEQQGAKSVGNLSTARSDEKQKIMLLEITSKTLNIRQEPSNKSKVLAVVKQGEIYEIIKTTTSGEENWFRIRLDDGTEGWVISKHVKLKE